MATAKMKAKQVQTNEGRRLVASNKKARHDYDFIETLECGIALVGSEVKSLRLSKVQLRDAYARIESAEMWLHGVHIAPYEYAAQFGIYDPMRIRKLLLHKNEIERLNAKLKHEKLTIVPTQIYFKGGRAKVEIALARGRHLYDKRRELAKRDADMEIRRVAKQLGVRIS